MYGCDHLPAPDDEDADDVLARLGVDGPFLLTVGTLEPRKNLPRLIEAYQRARLGLADAPPLVVVGPAGWGPGLPPAEGVHPAGPVTGAVLAALYRRALAVVYVPLHEGYGLPVVEAMHAGAPVVASPVPSAGDAALVVPATDVAAIAEAVRRVVAEADLRADLVARGTAHAAGLTWERACQAHGELWSQLHRGTR
jgi:glycosyltransferase involved in cell wall biosynthesis